MKILIYLSALVLSSLLSSAAFGVPKSPQALVALKPKSAQKALDLLAQGGVARVYTNSILADVQNLNCIVNRSAQMNHQANSTVCTGIGKGGRKLALSGSKASELYSMLETMKPSQNLPAADSVEIQRLNCSFTQKTGAQCRALK